MHSEPPLARIKAETEANQNAFERMRPNFTRHAGTYALMRSGTIVDFFPNRSAAMLAGYELCLDRIFSVHRVRPHPTRHRRPFFRAFQEAAGANFA